MGKEKFIHSVKKLFGLKSDEQKKKEAVKELIVKLKNRESLLKEELKSETSHKKQESIKDSIKIVKHQIKKGENLLKD